MSTEEAQVASPWDEQAVDLVCAEAKAAVIEYRKFSKQELDPQLSLEEHDTVKIRVSDILLGGGTAVFTRLSRFEDHLVDAIAIAHRDYDHWNE